MQRTVYPAPDPNVLFYRRERDNGRMEYASMQSMEQHDSQAWRGRFFIPGQAPVVLDQFSVELSQWDAVYALTQQDINGIVERVAQRVVEILGDRGASPAKVVEAGMEVVRLESVPAAIHMAAEKAAPEAEPEAEGLTCGTCSRTFKTAHGRKIHEARAH